MVVVLAFQPNMNVIFTPAFVEHMRKIATQASMDAIYIYTKRVGCNGLTYAFDATKAKVESEHELRVVVDDLEFVIPKTLELTFSGCVFDYQRQGLNYKVVVHNPNAKGTCGCGESFNLN